MKETLLGKCPLIQFHWFSLYINAYTCNLLIAVTKVNKYYAMAILPSVTGSNGKNGSEMKMKVLTCVLEYQRHSPLPCEPETAGS